MMTWSKRAVGEPGLLPRAAGERHIGDHQRRAAGQMRHCRDASSVSRGELRHLGRRLDQRDAWRPCSATRPPGRPRRRRRRNRRACRQNRAGSDSRQHHGVHAGAVARRPSAGPARSRRGGRRRRSASDAARAWSGTTLAVADLVGDAGIGQKALRGVEHRRRPPGCGAAGCRSSRRARSCSGRRPGSRCRRPCSSDSAKEMIDGVVGADEFVHARENRRLRRRSKSRRASGRSSPRQFAPCRPCPRRPRIDPGARVG